MKVYMIGRTQADLFPPDGDSRHHMPGKAEGSAFEARHHVLDGNRWEKDKPWDGEALIEFAGRLCYESWDMPNPDTATRSGYLKNILDQGHESILEHVSVTFYIEGVSRNLTHELIRHRHLSFSELSQRFVDMEDANQVVPPAYQELEDWDDMVPLAAEYVQKYNHNYEILKSEGYSRKQAREAARASLPGSTETKAVVTGNLRAWRDVLKRRLSIHADAEMQRFAQEILRQLKREYPDLFNDIEGIAE